MANLLLGVSKIVSLLKGKKDVVTTGLLSSTIRLQRYSFPKTKRASLLLLIVCGEFALK
jgi:hypothetical protein